tara:strand:- start:1158 stop:1658 length:501 start_codon:yes stop_codon:yes gene_type:complete
MESFNTHKWFKKQYLAEDKSDEDKVVAKGDGIEITQKQMERLHNGEVVHLSNGSVLSFVKEGHTEDKMERDMEALKRSRIKDNELKKLDAMRAFYRGETDVLPADLKEDNLNEINRDTFNMMEGMVNPETYKRFIDSLDDLLDDWYMEGFEKRDVVAYMEVIIPSN